MFNTPPSRKISGNSPESKWTDKLAEKSRIEMELPKTPISNSKIYPEGLRIILAALNELAALDKRDEMYKLSDLEGADCTTEFKSVFIDSEDVFTVSLEICHLDSKQPTGKFARRIRLPYEVAKNILLKKREF